MRTIQMKKWVAVILVIFSLTTICSAEEGAVSTEDLTGETITYCVEISCRLPDDIDASPEDVIEGIAQIIEDRLLYYGRDDASVQREGNTIRIDIPVSTGRLEIREQSDYEKDYYEEHPEKVKSWDELETILNSSQEPQNTEPDDILTDSLLSSLPNMDTDVETNTLAIGTNEYVQWPIPETEEDSQSAENTAEELLLMIKDEKSVRALVDAICKPPVIRFVNPYGFTFMKGDNIETVAYKPVNNTENGMDSNVDSNPDNEASLYQVEIVLTEDGKELFADRTTQYIGSMIMICLDRKVLLTSILNTAVTDGRLVITGDDSEGKVTGFAQKMQAAIYWPEMILKTLDQIP